FPTPTSPMNPLPDHQKTGSREIAQGYINGHDWVFRSGRAYFKKYRPNYLIVQLWNEEIADPCKEKKGSSLQVHLTAPKELATWKISPGTPFNSNLSIFFTDFDFKPKLRDNMVADQGEITFTAIEKDSVSGYVMGVFQSPKARAKDSRVVGDFVVPFCQ
ncbi:MAG: hypothetical protein ACXWRA_02835, partial [Pseudobdellovibrionaceae bacterium]